VISPGESTGSRKPPTRIEIFDAALATYVSMNGPGRDKFADEEMAKMRERAVRIGCAPQCVLNDVQFIHDLIRDMRKQVMEAAS
jgi:hypothetical protein